VLRQGRCGSHGHRGWKSSPGTAGLETGRAGFRRALRRWNPQLTRVMKDLILLVADKNIQFALNGGLNRPESLGIRRIALDFRQHPGRDGGTRSNGAQVLALEKARFSHALLVLDHEGSGAGALEALELEAQLDEQLNSTWGDRAKAIVIAPEVDIWMWGSDNKLAQILKWPRQESIRDWLKNDGFEFAENGKPQRPKEALEAVFRICKRPRSSSAYQQIAAGISLTRCEDPAFQRLRSSLRNWFPAHAP